MPELHILIQYNLISDLKKFLVQIEENVEYINEDVTSLSLVLSSNEGFVWAVTKEELDARKNELLEG